MSDGHGFRVYTRRGNPFTKKHHNLHTVRNAVYAGYVRRLPTKMLAINFDFTRERLTIQEPLPIVNEQDVPAWQIPAPPDVEGFLKALVRKGYQDVDELLIRIGTEFQTRLPGYHALVSASLKAVLDHACPRSILSRKTGSREYGNRVYQRQLHERT